MRFETVSIAGRSGGQRSSSFVALVLLLGGAPLYAIAQATACYQHDVMSRAAASYFSTVVAACADRLRIAQSPTPESYCSAHADDCTNYVSVQPNGLSCDLTGINPHNGESHIESTPLYDCSNDPKKLPEQSCPAPNGVMPGSGTTVISDTDGVDNSGDEGAGLTYQSNVSLGAGANQGRWSFGWQRSLDVSGANNPNGVVLVQGADDSVTAFQRNGNAWVPPTGQDSLQAVTDSSGNNNGWAHNIAKTGVTETYDAKGRLQSVRERNGRTTTLSYNSSNQLTAVTDPRGRSKTFAYDGSSRVASVTQPDGTATSYAYTASGMLANITYADGATRQFHYDDTRFPTALTSIVDENGWVYATYTYDASRRVSTSQNSGGINSYQFTYQNNPPQTTVVDAANNSRTYSYMMQKGALLPTSISAPCNLCSAARQSSSYDTNNNLIQDTDYNGTVTTHAYDVQGRETQRVEGSGTPTARTTTTEWHSVWNLPLRIASPTKLQSYSYDGNGSLVSYSETPTADSNGSEGFSAQPAGPARSTSWTYTSDGQLATSKGPRTDVNDGTTYVYRTADDNATPPQYRKGDLYQILNPLGHATTINQYDANGRPLQTTDANGAVTTFIYSTRGRLVSKTVMATSGGAQTTTYDYDKVGQLTKVTQPDGGTVNLSYDAAHRLTGAADNQGNSISYMLDAVGNRTQEQIKDPSGSLARQVNRVFDAMNRPLQVTVGATAPTSSSGGTAPLVKVQAAGVTAVDYADPFIPSNAIDGNPNTLWSTGTPPAWIEVDLGAPVQLRFIRAMVYQTGTGPLQFDVTGGVNPAPTSAIAAKSGQYADQAWMELPLDQSVGPVRYVRFTTNTAAYRAAWRELEFYK